MMGVRGTDFMISTNGVNTSTMLFEGEIVFNKLNDRSEISSKNLEDIVDRGVRIYPGEFSVMESGRPLPTVPALLNVQQREQLEKNSEFDSNRTPSNTSETGSTKTVVPEGLSGQQVSNTADTLKTEVAQVAPANTPSSKDPEGYVKGDLIKPANGSFVHVESGIIIPPGPDSVLDGNTNTFIPGQESGKVALDGSYIPPKNVEITDDGKILVAIPGKDGPVVTEIPKPAPVVTLTSVSLGETQEKINTNTAPVTTTKTTNGDIPLPQSGIDTRFTPTGGYTGSNDASRVLSGGTEKVDTTIIIKPPPL